MCFIPKVMQGFSSRSSSIFKCKMKVPGQYDVILFPRPLASLNRSVKLELTQTKLYMSVYGSMTVLTFPKKVE